MIGNIADNLPKLGHLTFNHIHDLIAVHKSDDLSYQYANPATFKFLGYTQKELYGKSPMELIHPDDAERALDSFKGVLLSGHGQDKFRYRKKDDTYCWLEVTGITLNTAADKGIIVTISRNIDGENKSMREENYLSKQPYHMSVENQTELAGPGTPELNDGPASLTFNTDQKNPEKTLQQQIAAQSLLLEISKQFASSISSNLDAMIDLTLKQIGEFDQSDRSYVFLFFDDGLRMSNTHEWCAEGISSGIYGLQNLPTGEFLCISQLRNREITYIPRVSDLPPEAQTEKEILQAQDIQSLIMVPMVVNGQLIGFLGFDSVQAERQWSQESIMILESAAQSISNALQRKKMRSI